MKHQKAVTKGVGLEVRRRTKGIMETEGYTIVYCPNCGANSWELLPTGQRRCSSCAHIRFGSVARLRIDEQRIMRNLIVKLADKGTSRTQM